MKKIFSLLFVFIFTLAFSSCGDGKTTASSGKEEVTVFMGEGKMTVLRAMISTNLFIADEVLGENHLPVDTNKTVKNQNGTFAPVTSDRIKSYQELESTLKSAYTEETAERLLAEQKKYVEIDGKLYFDMQYHIADAGIKYDRNTIETEYISTDENGVHTINVKLKTSEGKNAGLTVRAAEINGTLRLCDLYN